MEEQPTNEIRRYRPGCFDYGEAETVKFSTLNQLLSISWIKRFAELPEFHQFSISDPHLMAEYKEGRKWWVCGTLKNNVESLPKWEEPQ